MRAVWLLLCVSLPVLAAAPPAPTADDIEDDLDILRWLTAIDLTPEQAESWAATVAEARTKVDEINAKWDGPEVVLAMMAIREAVLRGEPVSGEMRSAVRAARARAFGVDDPDDLDDADELRWDAVRPLMELPLQGLTPAQLRAVARPYTIDEAADWLDFIQDGLDEAPEEFGADLDEALADLADDRDEDGAAIAEDLRTLVAEARGLAVAEFFEQRDQLRAELVDILGPRVSPDLLRDMAGDRLAEAIIDEPRLAICLKDWSERPAG